MAERAVFEGVNIVVKDMQAMVTFYERLGLQFRAAGDGWEDSHRSGVSGEAPDFDLDSAAFARVWNTGWPEGETGVVVGFHVTSRTAVDELYSELVAAGYPSQQPPYDAFWGARYAVVTDPDGDSVGLMSDADEAYRSEPPPPSS